MKSLKYILIGLLNGLMVLNACTNPKPETVFTKTTIGVKYTCPMHPQILEDHPGSCPICGMTLIKKSGQASEGAGINLSTVLQPVNSSVVSNIKTIVPEEKEESAEITARGYLDFDSRTFNNIASRYSGRIEKLYIKYAFQEIHKGQRIFDIYSPDMVTAQQDLIYVTKNSSRETSLVNAARQKLFLLGMTSEQVDQVVKTGQAYYSLPVYSPYEGHVHDAAHSQMSGAKEQTPDPEFTGNLPLSVKEGMFVEKGQTLFNVVDPHMLWAVIKIDRSAMSALKLNQRVKISLPDQPGKTILGKVNFIEPMLKEGDKTTTVRVYLNNMDHELKVNSIVNATIQTGAVKGIWIPRTALLDLGRTQIVWLKNGALYKAHNVTPGIIKNNEIEIKSGLTVADTLAADAQYLTDSESFIKTKGDE